MIVEWPAINQKILQEGTSWELAGGVVADETRSGKQKRRAANAFDADSFTVKMEFTLEEYRVLRNWWKNTLRRGVNHFRFPVVDDNTGEMRVYRFTSDFRLPVSNPDTDMVSISMQWEEVNDTESPA
jgi:hypothetical protein